MFADNSGNHSSEHFWIPRLHKSAYKKDNKKFVRRYLVEDRTGEGIITVFDRTYKDNPDAWDHNGNMLIVECAINVFMDRKGLVVNKVIKNCGGIDGRL